MSVSATLHVTHTAKQHHAVSLLQRPQITSLTLIRLKCLYICEGRVGREVAREWELKDNSSIHIFS